jgi:hypothetical protein
MTRRNEEEGGEERRGLPGVGSVASGLAVELVERAVASKILCKIVFFEVSEETRYF